MNENGEVLNMAKRIVTKIGNIFSLEIDGEYKCYFQYIANDRTQLNSSVIRVFKKHYELHENPSMDERAWLFADSTNAL